MSGSTGAGRGLHPACHLYHKQSLDELRLCNHTYFWGERLSVRNLFFKSCSFELNYSFSRLKFWRISCTWPLSPPTAGYRPRYSCNCLTLFWSLFDCELKDSSCWRTCEEDCLTLSGCPPSSCTLLSSLRSESGPGECEAFLGDLDLSC